MENGQLQSQLAKFWFAYAANRTKAFLEFVDATFGVDELSEASEEWVGIGSDTDRDHAVFDAVDDFFFLRRLGRARDEAFTSSHIDEYDWIVFWMDVLFHGIEC